jgi:hypothetical protein
VPYKAFTLPTWGGQWKYINGKTITVPTGLEICIRQNSILASSVEQNLMDLYNKSAMNSNDAPFMQGRTSPLERNRSDD